MCAIFSQTIRDCARSKWSVPSQRRSFVVARHVHEFARLCFPLTRACARSFARSFARAQACEVSAQNNQSHQVCWTRLDLFECLFQPYLRLRGLCEFARDLVEYITFGIHPDHAYAHCPSRRLPSALLLVCHVLIPLPCPLPCGFSLPLFLPAPSAFEPCKNTRTFRGAVCCRRIWRKF